MQNLSSSLAEARVSPGSAAELIPLGFTPSTGLRISFSGRQVELGNLFRASECKTAPTVSFETETESSTADSSSSSSPRYLLLLVDPDAPTPDEPKFAYWRHWVVSGLQPGVDVEGQALTEYLGPGPKDDSKPHRYLFLLFREAGQPLVKADVGGEEFVQRRSFDAVGFVRRHGLRLVGVNWMLGAGDGWEG